MVERVPTAVPVEAFSAIEVPERAMSVGASLTLVTVTLNCFSVVRPPRSVERIRIA